MNQNILNIPSSSNEVTIISAGGSGKMNHAQVSSKSNPGIIVSNQGSNPGIIVSNVSKQGSNQNVLVNVGGRK